MRFYTLAALMAGSAIAAPRPEGLDYATKAKRDNSQCSLLPASTDTPANFLANPKYPAAANGAGLPPAGYTQSFKNLQASSNTVGYMGYSTLDTYDVKMCASRCNNVIGCSAFNIYFEPVDPTATCSNPPSVEVIKCAYWGGPVSAETATNTGQYRRDFQVVIAGSNGYTSKSISTPPGYTGPVYLGNAAINAPLDCNGANTYMGYKLFTSGAFDAGRCAAACSDQSAYNLAHPPKTGKPQTCQFFNTYVQYKNNVAEGQFCAMYSETWAPAFATNRGETRGTDKITIAYSFAFSNGTANADQPVGCTNPTSPK